MFAPSDYRKQALDYGARAKTADTPDARTKLHALAQSFRPLADNEQWLADNHGKTIRSEHEQVSSREAVGESESGLAKDEEYILRCLGAAVILQWNTLPTKLQRALFDTAGSMGELIETGELRSRVARFLHKHKDDTGSGREGSGA